MRLLKPIHNAMKSVTGWVEKDGFPIWLFAVTFFSLWLAGMVLVLVLAAIDWVRDRHLI